MKKAQFDFEPQLTTDEGGVLHICFEAEAKEITIDNMHGEGDDAEAETRTIYEAYSVRLERPVTYERVVAAIVNAEYSSDQMQAIINNHLFDSTDTEHEAQYTAMQEWRTLAKKVAHEVIIATDGGTDCGV